MKSRIYRLHPPGIRIQLTLWYTAIFALMLLIAGGVFYGALKLTLESRVDTELNARANLIATGITWDHSDITIQDVMGTLPGLGTSPSSHIAPDNDLAVWVRVLDAQGKPVYASPVFQRRLLPDASVQIPLTGKTWHESIRIENVDYIHFLSIPLVDHGQIYGILQVGQSLALVTTTLSISAVLLAMVLPILFAIGAFGSYWLAGRAFASVRRLTRIADSIQAGGDLRQRIPAPIAHDELYDLAQTLNAMLQRLDAAFSLQRRFIADASHDLRTPVAAMLSLAENARDGVSEQETPQVLADIANQAQRLRQLITNLLHLSRADEGQLPMEWEEVRLDYLVRDVAISLLPLAEDRHISLAPGQLDGAVIRGDMAQLILVIMNLVDNALAYTPEGGTVTLSVRRSANHATIMIQDTGIGIAANDLPYIFDRFYRADPARQRATGGSGLGLAIVRVIVAAHNGTMTVESTPGKGSTFVLKLPLQGEKKEDTA
jgi:two-component system, OmpR family, sensor kinase